MFETESTPKSKAVMGKPRHKFEDLVYPAYIKAEIDALLEEEPFAHALIEEGLHPRRKILLYGPSGCGKTSIAHALASALDLSLLEAPSDQLQSKYVGESEKNIAATIKQACDEKCVLLIDEFDSIAMERQEGRRYATAVVNTLLTSLENNEMEGFLVACTNHKDHLDQALLRRFDLVIEIPMPTEEALLTIAEKVIRGRYSIDPKDALDGGNTPALVERRAKDLLRREVIKQERINPRPKKVVVKKKTAQVRADVSASFDGYNDSVKIPHLPMPSWLDEAAPARYAPNFSSFVQEKRDAERRDYDRQRGRGRVRG